MKLKEIKILLSQINSFSKPKKKLEQYNTPFDLSIQILELINSYDNIENKKILDLCGGPGIFSINASFYEPKLIFNLEIDIDAIKDCKNNIEKLENISNFNFDKINILNADFNNFNFFNTFDITIVNPPFGMHKKGTDIKCLEFALKVSKIIYVLHSRKTRNFYLKKFKNIKILAEMKYEIFEMYEWHKKKKIIIDVDLYRIVSDL